MLVLWGFDGGVEVVAGGFVGAGKGGGKGRPCR